MRRGIEMFGRWFASAAAVWQTTVVCVAVVAAEFADPHLDAHGFWLLYWATVYSAITQPILAYVGAQSGLKTDEVLARLEAMERREIELLERGNP